MYIAHSNIQPAKEAAKPVKKLTPKQERAEQFAREMAYKGYKRACRMFAAEIKEIQKYFPGWVPEFRYKPKAS